MRFTQKFLLILLSVCIVALVLVGLVVFKKQHSQESFQSPTPSGALQFTEGERLQRSVSVDGMKRSYTMYLPREAQTNGKPYSILFAFHPGGASAKFMEEHAPFHLDPSANSFVVIYPDGYRRSFNAGECCGQAFEKNIDDIAFFKAIMADAGTVVPVEAKAYLTGFSNGSMMTFGLVCKVPELVAAAVPYASAIVMDDCMEGQPVPILYLNGGADTTTLNASPAVEDPKFANGIKALVKPYEALDVVAARNGCEIAHEPTVGLPAIDASCEAYVGCSDAAPVSMCIIPNLGHAWPGSGDESEMTAMGERLGPYRPELDPTGPILDFFLAHPVE